MEPIQIIQPIFNHIDSESILFETQAIEPIQPMHGYINSQSENFETQVIEPIDKVDAIYDQLDYFDEIED